jgi:hypothetical protein
MKTEPVEITVVDGKPYSIKYGNAIMNGKSTFFDIADNLHQGTISEVVLGDGKVIRGSTLEVSSVLPLDNKAATFASVIYKIDGQSIVRRVKISEGAKIIILQTDINFI